MERANDNLSMKINRAGKRDVQRSGRVGIAECRPKGGGVSCVCIWGRVPRPTGAEAWRLLGESCGGSLAGSEQCEMCSALVGEQEWTDLDRDGPVHHQRDFSRKHRKPSEV